MVSDLVLEIIPAFPLLTIRLLISSIILGGILLYTRKTIRLPRRDLFMVSGIGIIGFGISLGAQFIGTERSTAVNGALITSASPAFILIFAVLLLHERLNLAKIGAVAVATIGVIIIIDPSRADFSSETFSGDIMLALAAVTWGLYSVLVRKMSDRVDTLVFSFVAPVGGLLLTIPAGVISLRHETIGEITPAVILGILYLGIISTAVAMWMWNRSFALVKASTASLFFFAQPLVGAALSVIILQQVITNNLIIGGTLIILGVLVSIVGENA